ncbi:hypothetical protein [Kribbella shirazensis]|uniref:Uncharacterized protein n=1 Tax=Kribbella shirazensis TaxID=1105143 RepID=A0A7X5VH46_9ACTN|nr:hypothetical protein [Kribbella shirazensis]NIK61092.1 hypothetical protein [Kribbella shirazensis]
MEEQLWEAREVVAGANFKEYPALLYCWSYQDGLQDALYRIGLRRASGEYSDSHHVQALIRQYEDLENKAYDDERYEDVAYIQGYGNGLMLLLDDDEFGLSDHIPMYFFYGSQGDSALRTADEFWQALKRSRRCAPKQRAKAREIAALTPDGMVMRHLPFLPDLPDSNW